MPNTMCDLDCSLNLFQVHDYRPNGDVKCVKECDEMNAVESSVDISGFRSPMCRYC